MTIAVPKEHPLAAKQAKHALFLQVLSENQMLTNELTSLGDLNTRIAVLLSMTATPREKSISACLS